MKVDIKEKIEELQSIASEDITDYPDSAIYEAAARKEVAEMALDVILVLQTLLSAALMRIDYYEEQEKEANNKQ